ncbi:MAG: hypothetical protein ACOY0T_05740 [Myxococcota bacterium]
MTEPPPPARGHMVLYDRMDPPLSPGEYRVHVETTVSLSGATLPALDRYMRIDGPRYRLAPTEVAGVFPPRNARGPFTDALPHVALGRRTLPWERSADPNGVLVPPARPAGSPPFPSGSPPWLALLLFDETTAKEASVVTDQKVVDVLPTSVKAVLNPPADATCDVIEVERNLLLSLLPSLEEIHLLSHVRQVNIEDRELSAGDSDGWFSVVVCARVPLPNRKYRACLVSLEARTDLIQANPPAVQTGIIVDPVLTLPVAIESETTDLTMFEISNSVSLDSLTAHVSASALDATPNAGSSAATSVSTTAGTSAAVGASAAATNAIGEFAEHIYLPHDRFYIIKEKLILLHSWTFECTGTGTFQGLAENLDVGLIGDVRGDWPKVTDTAHLAIEIGDRSGSRETVFYRGPLVPFPISRDTRGPYHSADQARRISPETGLEDISYAAAFEVGRLLAAADARLAQELMRWRRGDYRRSLEKRLDHLIRTRFPTLIERFRIDHLAASLVERWQDPRVRYTDPAEFQLFADAPGLDANSLALAWNLDVSRAASLLALDSVTEAGPIDRTGVIDTTPVTLESVASDLPALERLGLARERQAPSALDAEGLYIPRGGGL